MPISRLRRWGIATLAGLIALLFGFGSTPASAGLIDAPWDKLLHLALFATLTVALRLALPRLPLAMIATLAIGFALADELHQAWVPGRHPDWEDGLADLAGIAGGLLLWPGLIRRLPGSTVEAG